MKKEKENSKSIKNRFLNPLIFLSLFFSELLKNFKNIYILISFDSFLT